jgi:hypothetical protein
MTFSEKMRGIVHKGVADAKDLGSMGVLKLEIMQLQSQSEKLIAKLGNEVYEALVDRNQASVSRETPSIRDILNKIEGLRARNDLKEKEYRSVNRKRKAALTTVDHA